MRVGLVVPGFSADANDWCIPALRDLVRQLAPVADIHVFALRYPYRAAQYDLFGARVTALGGGEARGRGSAGLWGRASMALAAEHRRRPFDLLHAFWAGETGGLTALVGRALAIPTVVSLAGGELVGLREIGYGGMLRRAERVKTRLAIRLAQAVTAGSTLALALAEPWLRPPAASRARRIPLGVDLTRFTPVPLSRANGRARILHVASLARVKDQAVLLRAAALLAQRRYAFELELVGSGPLEPELRSLAARLGLDNVIRWRGAIGHERLPGEYPRAQLFVLSSRHEAQGMAALEAAACGLPVVGTRVGIVPELAPNAGRVAPVGDAGGLADGIAELLDDPPTRTRLGCSARELAAAEFGLEQCAARFLDLYAEVTARSRNRHP
jgi:glycosyltransferase involved in cell wall biosynthesis